MRIILFVADVVVLMMGIGLFTTYSQSKHVGILLAAFLAVGSATLSFLLGAWWPLVVGFVLAWILRLIGGDPGYR